METLKKIYKKLLLVAAYTIIACIVYGYWFYIIWGKWYISLIIILVAIIIGGVIGYFYVKNDLKPETKEEPIDTPKEMETVEEEPISKEI